MKREIGKEYLGLLLRAGGFLILMWLLFSRIFFLTRVQGMEMWPSLKDGDVAFGVRIVQEYRSGDVIAYEEDEGLSFARVTGKAEDEEEAWEVQKDASDQVSQVITEAQIRGKVLTILRRRI